MNERNTRTLLEILSKKYSWVNYYPKQRIVFLHPDSAPVLVVNCVDNYVKNVHYYIYVPYYGASYCCDLLSFNGFYEDALGKVEFLIKKHWINVENRDWLDRLHSRPKH